MIVAMLPKYSFPHEAAIRINMPVLIFSVGVALFTGILFGLWPALQLSRPEVSQVMQASSRKFAGGVRGRTHQQCADRRADCADAGDAGRSGRGDGRIFALMNTQLGYDPHNVMSVGIPVHDETLQDLGGAGDVL